MAKNEINVRPELRTCKVQSDVGEFNALFHCWEQYSEIVNPSYMQGGTIGGQLSAVYGIVEDENGKVYRAFPYSIQFTDNAFAEYAWPEDNG